VPHRTPVVDSTVHEALRGAKKGFKDPFAPQGLFEDLGLKYVGPIDGHDVTPVDAALPEPAARHRPVAVVEDNSRATVLGSAVALSDAEADVSVRRFGIPEQFLAHAKRGEDLAGIGLTPVEIADRISASLAMRAEPSEQPPDPQA
jgi:deoxyxylulose-5-phosphate synthase